MPSYLDFDSTKNFRDYILGRTLKRDNGPQTFSASNYAEQSTSDIPNKELGGVEPTNPNLNGQRIINLYNPSDVNYIQDLNVITFSQVLSLYPYFVFGEHNLVGIMSNESFDNESKLFQFAASNIKNNPEGPVLSRISRNIEKTTNGRVRLIDAMNGNTSTAINLVTGREPLVDPNYQITVSKTLPGKAIDLLEVVAGVTAPFSEIPGNYLSKPNHPGNQVNYRPEAKSEIGKIYQDVTGALGSLIGIQRRPDRDRKPSDLLLEYTSQGQKNRLYEMINFNNYGPNYTTTARSQNTSKIFNFVDKVAQGVKNIIGTEAPVSKAYIGDDRGDDVKYAMGDLNDRIVKSPYYLSLKFETTGNESQTGKTSADIWNDPKYNKNITEGGNLAGNFTWIQKGTTNKVGEYNKKYEEQKISDTLSTQYSFSEKTLLYKTQELLDSGTNDRTHVGNVIDQTSRYFKDGNIKISKGSAIQYVNKFNQEEAGIEYCRVWTKDNSYSNYNNTMKKTSNLRKYDGSILGGNSRVWNLNMAPMSNGKKSFDNSTNIVSGSTLYGNTFYAQKYMFSIENLAWKSSNKAGFRVMDLPACERGPNGGRVMWFPPYDLKVQEQNTANWDKNSFLGRPEPIYTYLDTERNGTISFKVVVDHPSILNLLVRDYFEGWDDAKADNFINAFFAGCEELDFYELINRFTTLDKDDLNLIKQYLNSGTSKEVIDTFKYTSEPVPVDNPTPNPTVDTNTPNGDVDIQGSLFFKNDIPTKNKFKGRTDDAFETIFTGYTNESGSYITTQTNDLNNLIASGTPQDQYTLFKKSGTTLNDAITAGTVSVSGITGNTSQAFANAVVDYDKLKTQLDQLKLDILSGYTEEAVLLIKVSTSEVASNEYNFYLASRRAYSIAKDVIERVSNDPSKAPSLKWFTDDYLSNNITNGLSYKIDNSFEYSFKDLGYTDKNGRLTIFVATKGETTNINLNGVDENCAQAFTNQSLKITAPIAFYCRSGSYKLTYKKNIPQSPEDKTPPTIKVPKISVSPDNKEITKIRPKPSIDVMKRIIMKTLSECHYFKKLEDTDPLVFKSLRDKLKYFHPAFHSMTPEGLNSRLTFLHQCLRPGDTIPIKGISDERDLNARNTAFGPPPVCVVRIGDFYHSKVIIRDLNITFDDGTWDLNPEGIGIQPMLANVTLQVSFLGGHGLERPVEKLQNALSSNFYANTEMYDERSISTATKIAGKDADKFTKEFLEGLVRKANVDLNAKTIDPNDKIAYGAHIGKVDYYNTIIYTDIITNLFNNLETYITSYKDLINITQKKYTKVLNPLMLHKNFRTISQTNFVVFTGVTAEDVLVDLFGEYPQCEDCGVGKLVDDFQTVFNAKVEATDNVKLLGLDFVGQEVYPVLYDILIDFIKQTADDVFNNIINDQSSKSLQKARIELVNNLDKLNYITKYSGDPTADVSVSRRTNLTDFTSSGFYGYYKDQLNWFLDLNTKLNNSVSGLTQSDYDNLSDTNYENILKGILYGKENDIVALCEDEDIFGNDPTNANLNLAQISKNLATFTLPSSDINVTINKIPTISTEKNIFYIMSTDVDITDATEKEIVRKIFRDKNNIEDNKLNFYKP